MAEADTMKTVGELREHLVSKASTDTEFRAQLLADPSTAIKNELGLTVPAGFTIKVHEETDDTGHLVLSPPAQLSEAELARAPGGTVRNEDGTTNDEAITFWD